MHQRSARTSNLRRADRRGYAKMHDVDALCAALLPRLTLNNEGLASDFRTAAAASGAGGVRKDPPVMRALERQARANFIAGLLDAWIIARGPGLARRRPGILGDSSLAP
jgi:hypothetical protein